MRHPHSVKSLLLALLVLSVGTVGAERSDSVAALETSCGGTDLAASEPAFEKAHGALHGLIGATGGHLGGDGTHEPQL